MWKNNKTDFLNPFLNTSNLSSPFNKINQNKSQNDPFEDLFKLALNTPLSKVKKSEEKFSLVFDTQDKIQKEVILGMFLKESILKISKNLLLLYILMTFF